MLFLTWMILKRCLQEVMNPFLFHERVMKKKWGKSYVHTTVQIFIAFREIIRKTTLNSPFIITERRILMNDNRKKQTFMQKPIERHDTASWADIKDLKRDSGVIIPKETGVINAREYVEENQK